MSRTVNGTAVLDVLEKVYGKGAMVDACCRDIVHVLREGDLGEDPEHTITLRIWDWFAGGTTAASAAKQVMAAVGQEDARSERGG